MTYKMTPNRSTLLRFVKKNKGITLLPYLATVDFLNKDRCFLNKFREPVPVREIGLVTHKYFVKKGILKLLKLEIHNNVNPLLEQNNKEEWLISLI